MKIFIQKPCLRRFCQFTALGLLVALPLQAATLSIVAGERVYGLIAERMAGTDAVVTSLVSSPAQDPHDYEPTAAAARAVADADIVIENGAGYDAWLEKLLAANAHPGRRVISIATLLHRGDGQNPHLWFNPKTIPALAAALDVELSAAHPENTARFDRQRDQMLAALMPVFRKIAALREKFKGTNITATEPVFGEMTDALGLTMRNQKFQLAIMNDSEPAASDMAAFEQDLQQRTVRALIVNTQTDSPLITKLTALAVANGVGIMQVEETQPEKFTYEDWLLTRLDDLETALGHNAP
jgi:zinc/manganese transport system substrate-binding protein